MMIRHQRNAHRLMLPPFYSRRQLKKFIRLQHGLATSSQIKKDHGLVSDMVQTGAAHVDMKHIAIGSGCLLMSLFFLAMIAAGRD